MPTPLIKDLAKEANKPVKEVEKLWNDAIEQAEKKGLPDGPKHAYANSVVQKKLGIKKDETFTDFVESKLSAKDYIS
jgi:hypothetical protein